MDGYRNWFLILILPIITGCATTPLTGPGAGVEYTLTNVACRTVNHPLARVNSATTQALKKMDITISENIKNGQDRCIKSRTSELEIIINLETITAKATRIKVNAKKNLILKDRATATEIIHQIDRILEGRA